ncbi:hypothetical protein CDAR_449021, partial [Caerostris darwini]
RHYVLRCSAIRVCKLQDGFMNKNTTCIAMLFQLEAVFSGNSNSKLKDQQRKRQRILHTEFKYTRYVKEDLTGKVGRPCTSESKIKAQIIQQLILQ